MAIGRVVHGSVAKNEELVCIGRDGANRPLRAVKLQAYEGTAFAEQDRVEPGDIIILAGIEEVEIGDTITVRSSPRALRRITVDEPTIMMSFGVNNSPFAGREGKYVQAPRIYERLMRETLHNVALKVEGERNGDAFIVKGRGEFQMAILIEQMRREGFELTIGRPEIILRDGPNGKQEPVEHLFVDVDERYVGVVTEKLSLRKGRMSNLVNHGSGRVRLEFSIPSRGLIGYRNEFLTDTRGTGIMNSYLSGFEDYRGDFPSRTTGSLVSDREGEAVAYGLFNLEPRGRLLIQPGDKVYEGMVVGEHNRDNDLNVNVCRAKKLTNIRAAGKDENVTLTPVTALNLEQAIEFVREDELVEVTPENIRLRKRVLAANRR